jgi:ABC-type glycerol-3-phosphate transport system permease component
VTTADPARASRQSSVIRQARGAKVVAYVVLLVASVIVLVPVLWMFSTAVKGQQELFSTPPVWIPTAPNLDAFVRVWADYPFLTYFSNSLIVVGASTLISVAFSAFAGYGMARFEFRGKGSFLTFLLMSQMFPSIMLLIPYYKIIQATGLIDTHMALIVTYVSFQIPLCSWMMYGYFKGIPKELDEAAAIDGLGRFRTFWLVVMPLALPGAVATAIYAFISGWNEYMFALVLTQSEDMKTVAVGIGQLIGQYKIQWNDLMAASLYAIVPLAILFIFLQKHLVGGLAAGAVKS